MRALIVALLMIGLVPKAVADKPSDLPSQVEMVDAVQLLRLEEHANRAMAEYNAFLFQLAWKYKFEQVIGEPFDPRTLTIKRTKPPEPKPESKPEPKPTNPKRK